MTWLVPLGFIGLVGIIVLIIIYILKPNYQQKLLSSTFVWKMSLKSALPAGNRTSFQTSDGIRLHSLGRIRRRAGTQGLHPLRPVDVSPAEGLLKAM